MRERLSGRRLSVFLGESWVGVVALVIRCFVIICLCCCCCCFCILFSCFCVVLFSLFYLYLLIFLLDFTFRRSLLKRKFFILFFLCLFFYFFIFFIYRSITNSIVCFYFCRISISSVPFSVLTTLFFLPFQYLYTLVTLTFIMLHRC